MTTEQKLEIVIRNLYLAIGALEVLKTTKAAPIIKLIWDALEVIEKDEK